jgi:glutamate/tyrosine decarboxylase-like PLP-dependent enzyme
VAAIGDLVASVLNQNVTAWRSAPSAVAIERMVVRWLAEAVGCRNFAGSLTGGGSSANLMGLAMAREAKPPGTDAHPKPGVVYVSAETHMSIEKATILIGLGHHALQYVPVDDQFRMIPAALSQAIQSDIGNGKQPIAVVASAGTVSTGSIDPLDKIGTIAKEYGLWMHVDGAYGALAAMAVPEKFLGLDQADSISLDPHKWLYQPVDCGCLLFREPARARAVFAHSGDYTRSLTEDPEEGFAFFEESVELSRRFRALKLWLSLRYHGFAAFRETIRHDLHLAQHLSAVIRTRPELEMLAPVSLSVVCFRYRGAQPTDENVLNQLNVRILQRVVRRGRVFISNATIHKKFALRACIVNHRSTQEDVEAVVSEVLASAQDELKAPGRNS